MPNGKGSDDLGVFDDVQRPAKPSPPPVSISTTASKDVTTDLVDDADWDVPSLVVTEPASAAAHVPPVGHSILRTPLPAVMIAVPSSTKNAPRPSSAPPPGHVAAPLAELPPPALSGTISSIAPPFAMAGTFPPHRLADTNELAPSVAAPGPSRMRWGGVIGASIAVGLALGFVGRGKVGDAGVRSRPATLKATSSQPGVLLVVDGRQIGQLPREVSDLAPGDHHLVLEGEHYRPRASTVTLQAGEVRDLPAPVLEVARGVATFVVTTPGTALALVSADERREIRDASRPIEVDNAQSWTLEASKPGYEIQRIPIAFGNEFAKTFTVPLGTPEARVGLEPSQLPTDSPPPSLPASSSTGSSHSSRAATSSETTPPGNCTLNVNSIPRSKVVVDGRPFGLTPKLGISVPAGSHTVLFVGDNGRKSTSTTCAAGEQKAVSVRL